MAPLDESVDQSELDDEKPIKSVAPNAPATTIAWTTSKSGKLEGSGDEMSEKVSERQPELDNPACIKQRDSKDDESSKLSNQSMKKKNYGTCQQQPMDKLEKDGKASEDQQEYSIDLSSKLFKLTDQLEDGGNLAKSQEFPINQHNAEEGLEKFKQRLEKGGRKSNDSNNDLDEDSNKKPVLERLASIIPGLGIILSLCASLSLGTAGMLVKMTHSCNGIQVAVLRSLIQLVIYSFIIRLRRLTIYPEPGEWFPVFGRAVLGATSMCFTYYALNLIPLGDATAIRFSLPIWTLIISYFFLRESCHFTKILAVFVAVSGVVMIGKPDDCIYLGNLILRSFGWESDEEFKTHQQEHEEAKEREFESMFSKLNETLSASGHQNETTSDINSTILIKSTNEISRLSFNVDPSQVSIRQFEGSMLALASSVMLALSLIALRLARKTPAEVTIFWLSVSSVIIGNCILVALDEWSLPNNLTDIMFIILNGLCGSAGQWFITSALKIEQSGIIALARTFDIEVAFLYSALLLRENIRLTSVIGAVLVSLSVIIVVVPKWLGWDGIRSNDSSNQNETESSTNKGIEGQQNVVSHFDDNLTSNNSNVSSTDSNLANVKSS